MSNSVSCSLIVRVRGDEMNYRMLMKGAIRFQMGDEHGDVMEGQHD
jgi:hypothetical protein